MVLLPHPGRCCPFLPACHLHRRSTVSAAESPPSTPSVRTSGSPQPPSPPCSQRGHAGTLPREAAGGAGPGCGAGMRARDTGSGYRNRMRDRDTGSGCGMRDAGPGCGAGMRDRDAGPPAPSPGPAAARRDTAAGRDLRAKRQETLKISVWGFTFWVFFPRGIHILR